MNDREFSDALVWIVNSPIISLDTETSGLHPYEYDRAIGIGVANENHETYFPLRHRDDCLTYDQARNLLEALSSRRETIVFHNAIFDWPVLRNEGWTYPDPWLDVWDTMVVAWLLDENEVKNLEEQVRIWIDEDRARAQKQRQKAVKKIGWSNASFEDIKAYGAHDARNTFDLYLIQKQKIVKDSSLAVARLRENKFLRSCDEMIRCGVRVDHEQATRKLAECDVGIEQLECEYPGLNFDSPKQLAELLYSDAGWGIVATSFTAGGQPSTSKDSLLQFLPYEPRIADIFSYRKLRKARSTYYSPLVERVGTDGRVHPWYRPHGTKTGRMSCSDPNAQTLPHEDTLPGIKECFIAEEGFSLIECDLEQAELRVAAYYADDFVLRDHLAAGDVHAQTAMSLFGHPNGSHRKIAKNLNFGALYGIGAQKFVTTARRKGDDSMTEDQARQYLGQWRNLYSGVTDAMQDAQRVAEERGYVKLWPTGRRRRFDTYAARFEHPKDAFNSVVQGGVGEYMKELMMVLYEPARQTGVRIVLNVHDSLVFEIPRGMEDKWTIFVRKTAARINPFQISMPIGVKSWR